MTGVRAGVDIGGTKTAAVAVLPDGRVGERLRMPTGFGPQGVVDTAVEAVQRLAEESGLAVDAFASIGIGVPGAVDPVTGRVTHALNLGLEGLELGTELTARFGRPVRVDNDVNAAALGAYHLLGHDGSLAYLNLGTGLAAGFVLNGALWRGSRGAAGEIGHIPIDPAGPLCHCGQRGCLEVVASGSAIARAWPTDDPRPASALFAAAADGDPAAVEVRRRLVEHVAAAVRLLVVTVDVDRVVIGGGLSSLGGALLADIRAVLAGWEATPFWSAFELPDRVELLPDELPAAAVGAALVGVG